MNLQSNDFELFGVPAQFVQDPQQLAEHWKALQKQAHPDRFASQGAAAQRVAMQWSVRINEAYQRLKDPLKRAAYLCEMHDAPIRAEDNTAMPAAFLMEQMEWREALEEAQTAADIDALGDQVLRSRRALLERCQQLLDVEGDYLQAAQQVRALMFVARFSGDIDRRREQLGQ
ncbi:Fe-S protein assembly co-chaperone HscB [Comamonas sp. BIGb0152]|uniref:Fe-S protein assembly co-chaperone HscB n=1 Tax=Comamonas sp. BIGb0152 TaxID=2940601 RepID=UPI002169D77F|nr:Fe-S protein assembly co-chaperone HscB [Comamonas sp. BIGb0152]